LGLSSVIKLASNENPMGPSPKALAALSTLSAELALYPDGNGFELKNALSQQFGLEQNRFILGNGSNDVLDLVARTFLGPGRAAIYSQYAFAVYSLATQMAGAQGIEVVATAYGHDLDAMVRAVTPETRVVFVANPNNPTGTFVEGAELYAWLQRIPPQIVVVLDEAYTEFLPNALRYDAVPWLNQFPNLLICRTFSKAYGLAGLRVGFAMGHPALMDLMNRVRQPFNVSVPALIAATAALGDQEFLEQTRQMNDRGRQQLQKGFDRLGLTFVPGQGNFVLVEVGQGAKIYDQLLRLGVIVRPVGAYGLPRHLRVSIGTQAENDRFLACLAQVMTQEMVVAARVG